MRFMTFSKSQTAGPQPNSRKGQNEEAATNYPWFSNFRPGEEKQCPPTISYSPRHIEKSRVKSEMKSDELEFLAEHVVPGDRKRNYSATWFTD